MSIRRLRVCRRGISGFLLTLFLMPSLASAVTDVAPRLYVTSAQGHSVTVIDIGTNEVIDRFALDCRPVRMFVHGRELRVLNQASRSVAVIDRRTGKRISRLDVDAYPRPVADMAQVPSRRPWAQKLYVAGGTEVEGFDLRHERRLGAGDMGRVGRDAWLAALGEDPAIFGYLGPLLDVFPTRIVADRAGKTLYALSVVFGVGQSSLSVIDAATLRPRRHIPGGGSLLDIVVTRGGHVAAIDYQNSAVVVLDRKRLEIGSRIRLPESPWVLVAGPGPSEVIVAGKRTVYLVDLARGEVVKTISLGTESSRLNSLVVRPSVKVLFATDSVRGVVYEVALGSGRVERVIPVGLVARDRSLAVARDGTLYFGGNDIDPLQVIPPGSTESTRLPAMFGCFPAAIAISPDGARLVLSSHPMQVLDARTGTSLASLVVGSQVGGVAVGRDGRFVYVGDPSYKGSSLLVVDNATGSIVDRVAVGPDPGAVAVTSDGRNVLVLDIIDTDRLWTIDTATNRVVAQTKLPMSATGMAVCPGENSVYVTDGSRVAVVALGSQDAIPLSDKFGGAMGGAEVRCVGADALVVFGGVPDAPGRRLTVLDRNTLEVRRTVSVPRTGQGLRPSPSTSLLYVGQTATRSVAVVDLKRGETVANIPIGAIPSAMVLGTGKFGGGNQ